MPEHDLATPAPGEEPEQPGRWRRHAKRAALVAGAAAALALAGGGVAMAQSDTDTGTTETPSEQSAEGQTDREDCPRPPGGRAPSPPDGETDSETG
jgi:ferric-dicitrate binding protein FerR (iron transport regulator)